MNGGPRPEVCSSIENMSVQILSKPLSKVSGIPPFTYPEPTPNT